MKIKILQVFYGEDCLPYKDKERSVHFPIVGNGFQGAQNTTKIKFYYKDIGGSDTTWIANAKLPNGKIGYQMLNTAFDDEVGEPYAYLDLTSFYTQYKGDVYISLQGCGGGANVYFDDEDEIYKIEGNPTIQATGSIKLAINYATQFNGSDEEQTIDLQRILSELSNYLKISNGICIIDSQVEDISDYEENQIFYDIYSKHFMQKVGDALSPYDLVPFNQATVSIIVNPTTNINGRVFTHYTSEYGVFGTSPNQFYAYKIKYDGANCNETQARTYMSYMSGSNYLPKYNYDRPANSYFLQPDGQILKPQYDSTNGLLLIIMPKLATQSYVNDTFVQKANGENIIYGTSDYAQATIPYGVIATGGNIVKRDSDGHVIVPQTPTSNNQATSKKYVDDKVAEFAQNELQVVEELPSSGEEGIIYLVPIDPNDLTKGYNRYIWENNDWLSLGTTEIDLSDYVPYSGATENINLGNHSLQANEIFAETYKIGSVDSYIEKTSNADIVFVNGVGDIYLQPDGKLYYGSDEVATQNYVNNKQIAGISLTTNISAQALTDALVLANNTDIDNLF